MQRFRSHVAIVTGAGSGIGRAIALAFCAEGAHVCAFDIDQGALRRTAQLATTLPGSFTSKLVDVANSQEVTEAVQLAFRQHRRIDHLVNNAGINMPKGIRDLSASEWDKVMHVNLRSVYVLTRAVWGVFANQRSGTVVNISSIMGQVGGSGAPAYCTSKAGMLMLSRCLAKDGASLGIRVNCVCPGYVDTPIMERVFAAAADPERARQDVLERQPMGRFARPEEIASAVLFLASDAASFISGAELTVDGAVTATMIDG